MHLHHPPAILEQKFQAVLARVLMPATHTHRGWTWVPSSAHSLFAGRSLPLEVGLVHLYFPKGRALSFPSQSPNHSPAALSFPNQRHLTCCSILLLSFAQPSGISPAAAKILLSSPFFLNNVTPFLCLLLCAPLCISKDSHLQYILLPHAEMKSSQPNLRERLWGCFLPSQPGSFNYLFCPRDQIHNPP